MSKKLIALILFCMVLMTGCSLLDNLDTDTADNGSTQSAAEVGTDSLTQPHTDSEVAEYITKEAQSDDWVSQRLLRFKAYQYKTGVPMITFKEREKIEQYFKDTIFTDQGSDGQTVYQLMTEDHLFKDDELYVIKPEYGYSDSLWYYIGEINSDDRPNGIGMTGFFMEDEYMYTDSPSITISYIGEFKNGKKDGYGVQFYLPERHYYHPKTLMNIAEEFYESKNGSNSIPTQSEDDFYQDYYDEFYNDTPEDYEQKKQQHLMDIRPTYETILHMYGNYPIYEGEFKDNKFSGKGNYCCPYVVEADEFNYDDVSENDWITDAELIKQYCSRKDFIMDVGMYIGTFKDGKPNKCALYEKGEKTYDGKWKDFADPKD